jgi:hypothetical protein
MAERQRGILGGGGSAFWTNLLLGVSGIECNGAVTLLSKRDTLAVIIPCNIANLTASARSSGDGGSYLKRHGCQVNQ